MISPSDLTIVVTAVRHLSYWPITRPFIERYCEQMGYSLAVYTRDHVPSHISGSWNKLIAWQFAKTPHAVLWDADIVPLPHCLPIHDCLHPTMLGMPSMEPRPEIRRALVAKYGRREERSMHWETSLISVPECQRDFLSDLFESFGYSRHIDAEHGEVNARIVRQSVPVDRLACKFARPVVAPCELSDIADNYALRFTSQWHKDRNIGRLCRILRKLGYKLPH